MGVPIKYYFELNFERIFSTYLCFGTENCLHMRYKLNANIANSHFIGPSFILIVEVENIFTCSYLVSAVVVVAVVSCQGYVEPSLRNQLRDHCRTAHMQTLVDHHHTYIHFYLA